MQGYTHFFPIAYSATDQVTYQQDVVIHRSEGEGHQEERSGLKIWHVYVGNRCKSDYGDIRFTDASGNALAYYLWPDYDSSSARFTVQLEGATTAGTLVIWYGNPTATTTSDGTNTFLLYTDFDDGTSPFTHGAAAASFAGGFVSSATSLDPAGKSLKLSGGGKAKARYIPQTFGRGIQVDYYQYIPSNNPTTSLGGVHLASPGESSINGYQCVLDERGIHPNLQIRENFDYTSYFGGALKLTTITDRWYKIRVTWATDGTITFSRCDAITGQVYDTASGTDTTYSSGYLGFCTYNVSYFDQVTVRAYSATPPAATEFGPEQVPGTLHHVVFGSANMMVV